jgi:hypothetical protein
MPSAWLIKNWRASIEKRSTNRKRLTNELRHPIFSGLL